MSGAKRIILNGRNSLLPGALTRKTNERRTDRAIQAVNEGRYKQSLEDDQTIARRLTRERKLIFSVSLRIKHNFRQLYYLIALQHTLSLALHISAYGYLRLCFCCLYFTCIVPIF
uniref:Uncharacterized protein n=1 Tax=Anopheles coluzzii TaxID=1518534 RepID=A0A8W7PA67_ANOCL